MPLEKTSIDWTNPTGAYGPAVAVPKWLEQVLTANGHQLEVALGELYSRVLPQGALCSAAPQVCAAIVEGLDNPAEPKPARRAALLGLLDGFAQAARRAMAEGDTVDAEAIRDILIRSRRLFIARLRDPAPDIRALAAALLTAFPGVDPAELGAVEALYAIEREDDVESPAAGATSSFVDGESAFFETLSLLGQDPERGALLEALEMAKEPADHRCVAERLLRLVFHDQRTGWGQVSHSMLNADGSQSQCPGLIRLATRSLGLLIVMRVCPPLFQWHAKRRLARAQAAPGIQKVDYWGLKGDGPELPQTLSPVQIQVLQALAAKPGVWTFRTNLWNLFGLPDQPVALRKFASARSPCGKVGRGRDGPHGPPPAQIRTGAISAYGSYLGYLAAKRIEG